MKKIFCRIGDNEAINAAVQEELFNVGCAWPSGKKITQDGIETYKKSYCIGKVLDSTDPKIYYSDSIYYMGSRYTRLPIPEFIEEIKKSLEKKTFSVQLNREYTAVWTQGEKTIKVGDRNIIEVSKVLELANIIKKNNS